MKIVIHRGKAKDSDPRKEKLIADLERVTGKLRAAGVTRLTYNPEALESYSEALLRSSLVWANGLLQNLSKAKDAASDRATEALAAANALVSALQRLARSPIPADQVVAKANLSDAMKIAVELRSL